MNENRPDASFFSADSNRKQAPRSRNLAKAEIGVSTSATKVAMSGIRLPCVANDRNSSSDGVMEGSVALTCIIDGLSKRGSLLNLSISSARAQLHYKEWRFGSWPAVTNRRSLKVTVIESLPDGCSE